MNYRHKIRAVKDNVPWNKIKHISNWHGSKTWLGEKFAEWYYRKDGGNNILSLEDIQPNSPMTLDVEVLDVDHRVTTLLEVSCRLRYNLGTRIPVCIFNAVEKPMVATNVIGVVERPKVGVCRFIWEALRGSTVSPEQVDIEYDCTEIDKIRGVHITVPSSSKLIVKAWWELLDYINWERWRWHYRREVYVEQIIYLLVLFKRIQFALDKSDFPINKKASTKITDLTKYGFKSGDSLEKLRETLVVAFPRPDNHQTCSLLGQKLADVLRDCSSALAYLINSNPENKKIV